MKKGTFILVGSPFLTREPLNNPFQFIKTPSDANTDMDTERSMLLECCFNYLCSICTERF